MSLELKNYIWILPLIQYFTKKGILVDLKQACVHQQNEAKFCLPSTGTSISMGKTENPVMLCRASMKHNSCLCRSYRTICLSGSFYKNSRAIPSIKDTTKALTISPGRKDECISTLSISVALTSCCLITLNQNRVCHILLL